MRKLMWFSVGFAAAAALCALFRPGLWCILAGIGAGMIWLSFLLKRTGKRLGFLRGMLLGLSVGLLWSFFYDGILLKPLRLADGETRDISVELCDYPQESRYGGSVEGRVALDGRTYKILLYLDEFLEELKPGDTVSLSAELRLTAEGGKREPTFHRTRGIFLLAYPRGETEIHPAAKIPARFYPALWRKTLRERIDSYFPTDADGFMKALLLSDKSDLDYETRNTLSLAGLAHLIVVSGLHISILAGAVCLITQKRRWLTPVLGIPFVLAFAAIAGFSPSVTRAAVMQILIMLAMAFNREYDPPTALSVGALVILVVNPLAIASAGFQLSFAAVAGIFLFSQRLFHWLLREDHLNAAKGRGFRNRFLRFLAGSVSVTIGASVFTTPIAAGYFGLVSLLSPVTNLFCLSVVTLVFYLGAAACIVGGVWLAGGKILAKLAAVGVRYVLGVAGIAARFPLCAVYTDSVYVVLWLIFTYVLFGVFLLRRKRAGVFTACVALGLCAALLASWAEPLTDRFRVTAIDVGQGQCVLLQSGRRTFVVDCGGSDGDEAGESAARKLLSMGVCRIDGLILTHLDSDHVGGVKQLLRRISTDFVAFPAYEQPERVEKLRECTEEIKLMPVDLNYTFSFPAGSLKIFAPVKATDGNEGCLAVLFTVGDCDTLITGDMDGSQERLLLRREPLPDIEILVVGHHGSKYATSEDLLFALSPEIGIISVGDNRYGLPRMETISKLEAHGCTVYRTDKQGTILIRR